MALVLKDRVKVTTTTTGTGAFAIGGAQFGFQGFSAFADGDTTYYTAVDHATGAWETGLGTYSTTGPSLARTQVLASSTGAAINFGAGPKDLFVVYPADRAVLTENAAQYSFGSGTKMLFAQTAAPTGWTKDTTHDNKALRVVTGAASSGGSVAFTTAFAVQGVSGTVGNTTLAISQIPAHNHAWRTSSALGGTGFESGGLNNGGYVDGAAIANNGGGGSHNHTFTGTAINLAVQYVDVIIATKD